MPQEHAFAALMHDASEAYLLEIPRPIKNRMPEYKAIEDNLMMAIAAKFNFQYPMHDLVKDADNYALEHEWEEVFIKGNLLFKITQEDARTSFIERFNRLV